MSSIDDVMITHVIRDDLSERNYTSIKYFTKNSNGYHLLNGEGVYQQDDMDIFLNKNLVTRINPLPFKDNYKVWADPHGNLYYGPEDDRTRLSLKHNILNFCC